VFQLFINGNLIKYYTYFHEAWAEVYLNSKVFGIVIGPDNTYYVVNPALVN
jgi:hypothetical protein